MSLPRDPQKHFPSSRHSSHLRTEGSGRNNEFMEGTGFNTRCRWHYGTVGNGMRFFSRFHDILFCGIMERCTSANLRTAPRKSLFKSRSILPPSISLEGKRRGGGEAGRRKRSVAQQSVRKCRSPPPKEVAKKAPFPTCKPNLHAFKGHGGITLFLRGVMCVWYVCLRSVQAYSFAET